MSPRPIIALIVVAVGGHVVGHPGDDLGLVERGLGDFPGDAERLEDLGDALLLLDAVGGAGHLDGHPDEVALLHQPVVDEVLRPLAAHRTGGRRRHRRSSRAPRVRGVEVDDRDARRPRLGHHVDHASPGRGWWSRCRRRPAAMAARTASCCEGTSPEWNEVLTVWPVSAAQLLGALQEVGPDRVGRARRARSSRRSWPRPPGPSRGPGSGPGRRRPTAGYVSAWWFSSSGWVTRGSGGPCVWVGAPCTGRLGPERRRRRGTGHPAGPARSEGHSASDPRRAGSFRRHSPHADHRLQRAAARNVVGGGLAPVNGIPLGRHGAGTGRPGLGGTRRAPPASSARGAGPPGRRRSPRRR